MTNAITVETIGRRTYLRGNTYPVKDAIKAMGARWDRDVKGWWMSNAKARKNQDAIDQIVGQAAAQPAKAERKARAPRKASDRQVDYAASLIARIGHGWSDIFDGAPAPTVSTLRTMDASQVSEIISAIRGEY